MIFILISFTLAAFISFLFSKSNSFVYDGIPGPFLARVTKFYRVWLFWDGCGPERYIELHQKYGTVVRTGPNHVSISNPELIPIVYDLRHNFKKSNFYKVFRPLYKAVPLDTVFTIQDPVKQKALKAPLVAHMTSNPRLFATNIEMSIHLLVSKFSELDGAPINFSDWAFFWSFDLSYSMMFGDFFGYMQSGSDFNGIITAFLEIIRPAILLGHVPEYCSISLGSEPSMNFLRKLGTLPDPTQTFLKLIEEKIRMHELEHHEHDNTFLCKVLRGRDLTDEMQHTEAVNVMFEFFFASAVEIAVTLTSVVYCLVTNPRVLHKLSKILHSVSQDTRAHRIESENQFLTAVIKESLRLHTTNGPSMERLAPPGSYADNYAISEGTIVSVPHHVVHRDMSVYGVDAKEFRPERWLEADAITAKCMERSFMAFGKGSRGCTGRDFAMLQLRAVITSLLRNFNIELANEEIPIGLKTYWIIEFSNLDLVFKAI